MGFGDRPRLAQIQFINIVKKNQARMLVKVWQLVGIDAEIIHSSSHHKMRYSRWRKMLLAFRGLLLYVIVFTCVFIFVDDD